MLKQLGLIVNPVAGLGGRVGLKGSDGPDVVVRARELGAVAEAPARAIEALRKIERLKDRVEVLTYPHEMGEDECRTAGLYPRVLGRITSRRTTPRDTVAAAQDLLAAGVDLILFAGGDGTARNILGAVGGWVPALGIPAGVKIHSAVFAVSPRMAGEVAARYLEGEISGMREAEVMDIDEDAFRVGRLSAKLYGYMKVPEESRLIQGLKTGGLSTSREELDGIAAEVCGRILREDACFIIGPGTTTRAVMERLGLPNTLLGVDVVKKGELLAGDASEGQILRILGRAGPARIVVTAIGGQGHILGRGNQPISPAVIGRVGSENVMVVATKEKLVSLRGRPLLVDTGDEGTDRSLSGYVKVITGQAENVMYRIGFDNG